MLNKYKYLNHLVIWNIFFVLICIPTTGKMVDVFGTPMSISIFYFPFIYIIADVLTEVYGYAVARRVIWYNTLVQVAAMLLLQFVVIFPPAASFTNNDAYLTVFSVAPQVVVFGIMVVFIGDIVNNYVLAKMKVWQKGGSPASRFVLSTVAGEFANTAFFFTFGLWGLLPKEYLLNSIVMGTAAKVLVEIVMLPVTLRIASWLKRQEHVDAFDEKTDFNPLKF